MSVTRITDDTTREELAECLLHLCDHAKRQPHVLGVTQPSNWDVAHQRIDRVLADWETAT